MVTANIVKVIDVIRTTRERIQLKIKKMTRTRFEELNAALRSTGKQSTSAMNELLEFFLLNEEIEEDEFSYKKGKGIMYIPEPKYSQRFKITQEMINSLTDNKNE